MSNRKAFTLVVSFPIQMLFYIGLSLYLGIKVGDSVGYKPFFIILFIFIGIFTAFSNLYILFWRKK